MWQRTLLTQLLQNRCFSVSGAILCHYWTTAVQSAFIKSVFWNFSFFGSSVVTLQTAPAGLHWNSSVESCCCCTGFLFLLLTADLLHSYLFISSRLSLSLEFRPLCRALAYIFARTLFFTDLIKNLVWGGLCNLKAAVARFCGTFRPCSSSSSSLHSYFHQNMLVSWLWVFGKYRQQFVAQRNRCFLQFLWLLCYDFLNFFWPVESLTHLISPSCFDSIWLGSLH